MPKQILVVDDDSMIRNLVQSVLEAEGFEVTTLEDGKRVVDIMEDETKELDYSLIILDVCMPEMNGLDVVTHLKADEATKSIPVLMLTGEDTAEDIMSGYSVGADYYITKPFTRQQLLFVLEIVLNGWES
jgi:DNA-binding response OmpR family regulator